jgi:hypothetical protein
MAALLTKGPRDNWWDNAQASARFGLVMAAAPAAVYLWGALSRLDLALSSSDGVLALAIGLVLVVVRWVGVAFVFGALYSVLPGRIGPVKALWLAIVGFVPSGLAAELVGRWTGQPAGTYWLFTFLQLVVFLGVLAVAYDHASLRKGGHEGWSEQWDAYQLRTWRATVGYLAPFVAAVIALVEQFRTGVATDTVQAFLDVLLRS